MGRTKKISKFWKSNLEVDRMVPNYFQVRNQKETERIAWSAWTKFSIRGSLIQHLLAKLKRTIEGESSGESR